MAVQQESQLPRKVHNLILEDRKHLTVSGVTDVDSFDEESVVLFTDLGELTVHGYNLHMNKLSVETGEVIVDGDIASLSYRDELPKSGSLFGRIFK